MATPSHGWSPPSLVFFLTGLGPIEADVTGGTCVLTVEGRDQILDWLAHADRASTAPTATPSVTDRWAHEQAKHKPADKMSLEDRSMSGRVDATNDSVLGCIDSTSCARTGRAAEEKETAEFDLVAEKATLEDEATDSSESSDRQITVADPVATTPVPTTPASPISPALTGSDALSRAHRQLTLGQCFDTNNGAANTVNYDCSAYDDEPQYCGSGFDDVDFSANEMCCACGGGSGSAFPTIVPTSPLPTVNPVPTPPTDPDNLGPMTIKGQLAEEIQDATRLSRRIDESRRRLTQLGGPTPSAVPASCPEFVMEDDYGDGWNSAKHEKNDATTNIFRATGTLSSGNIGTDEVCLSGGCCSLRVTSGDYPDEITWNFGTMSGGAPFTRRYFLMVNGSIEEPFQFLCLTPAPTQTFQPTPAPTSTSTQVPSISSAPPPRPTFAPTMGVSLEARTWDELNDALQIDLVVVYMTHDTAFAEEITLDGGQSAAVFCDTVGEVDAAAGANYCATLSGGG